MDLKAAELLARGEMEKNSLQDWNFSMSYTLKTTFGRCNVKTRTIELSAVLTVLNNEVQVLDTIRHEIAHALREKERGYPLNLSAGQWHDYRWKQVAAALGAKPQQFYNPAGQKPTVVTGRVAPILWKKTCPNGHYGGLVPRRSKTACCGGCLRELGQYIRWNYTPNK